MEKDIDTKLYNEYLNGEKEAFEILYNKYKNKIKYFVFNIVKDYEKAEDITQDVFLYVLEHKLREGYSFKYYIFLVAKSRALNYKNMEKRRTDINEKYLFKEAENKKQDIVDIIEKEENKKKIIEAINELDDKYKNAIYLVKIEGLSYKETSQILGISLSNIKVLIHRGKKELRKILLKKGLNQMNNVAKVLLVILCTTLLLSGIVYAGVLIYKNLNKNHNVTFNPTYQSTLDEHTVNNLWIGTLDLAWKDLEEKVGGRIELEENIDIANELNNSNFSKEMLDENDYTINVTRTVTNGYSIETKLNKNLSFWYPFDNFNNDYNYTFGKDGTDYIKYFGINNASKEELNQNVEVLFYNGNNDFAVLLNTKEGDEIILYRTDENKSFNEYYEDIKNKKGNYNGSTTFEENDELLVPYVNVNGTVAYNELADKIIKNTNGMYISNVMQDVNFNLNESGCNMQSHATMTTEYLSVGSRYFWFRDTFIIFMKEGNSNMPYFALKVDNQDILEKKDESDEPKIVDSTVIAPENYKKYLQGGEYKFFEDENYEYYYPSHKTEVVEVFFKNGDIMTVEDALKEGKITIELLDKYGVEYKKIPKQ